MARTIGIDLGTTNSVMATIEGGEPVVIPNAEGERLTPSVVAVTPAASASSAGSPAARPSPTLTTPSFRSSASWAASSTIPSVQRDIKLVPYRLQAAPNGDVQVKMGDRWYSPQEISAMILQKLKADAEAYLGDKVDRAVVTVPAYFDNSQRDATKDAGRIAGLTSSASSTSRPPRRSPMVLTRRPTRKSAVYDLGGGTYDISILDLSEGVFQVLATNGDTHLGGDDFDQIIIDFLADEFKKRKASISARTAWRCSA